MRQLIQIALALLVAWTIFPQSSMAQGRGHAFGRARDRVRIEVRVRSDSRGVLCAPRRTVFGGFTTRFGRPHGWDRGRKTGWGYCDVPPGLAKKYGCREFVVRGDRKSVV